MLFIGALVVGCGGGDDGAGTEGPGAPGGPGGGPLAGGYTLEPFTPAEANVIIGQVLTSAGAPLAGATARIGEVEALTNEEGLYSLQVAPAERIVAHFSAPGYAPTTRTGSLLDGGRATVNAMLVRRAPAVTVEPGVATPVAGGAVTVPPGAARTASGEPASTVRVRVSPVDVRGPGLLAAPGDFSAVDAAEDIVQLETFGMADYQLVDEQGQPLNIAEGEVVTIEMILPEDTRLAEGDLVPAWAFDLESGRWVEEGSGTVAPYSQDATRLAFVAEVGHFSWWNADLPLETTCVRGVVRDCHGDPVPGADLRIEGLDYAGTTTAYAGAGGEYCGLVRVDSQVDVWAASGWGAERLVARQPAATGSGLTQTCEPSACTVVDVILPCTASESEFDCHDTAFAGCKGCVQGVVTSSEGAPVHNAKVTLTSGNVSFVRLTDESGRYCGPAGVGATTTVSASGLGLGVGAAQAVGEQGECPTCASAPTIAFEAGQGDDGDGFDFGPCMEQIGGIVIDEIIGEGADPNVLRLDSGFVLASDAPGFGSESGARVFGMSIRLLPTGTTDDLPGRPSATFRFGMAEGHPVVGVDYPLGVGAELEGAHAADGALSTALGGTVGLSSESYRNESPRGGFDDGLGGGFVRFDEVGQGPGGVVRGRFELQYVANCAPQAASVTVRGRFDATLSDAVGLFGILAGAGEEGFDWRVWECSLFSWVFSVYSGDFWGFGQLAAELDGQPIPLEPESSPGTARYAHASNQLSINVHGVGLYASLGLAAPMSGYNDLVASSDHLAVLQTQANGCIYQAESGGVTLTGFTSPEFDGWMNGTFDVVFAPIAGVGEGDCPSRVLTGSFGAPVCAQ